MASRGDLSSMKRFPLIDCGPFTGYAAPPSLALQAWSVHPLSCPLPASEGGAGKSGDVNSVLDVLRLVYGKQQRARCLPRHASAQNTGVSNLFKRFFDFLERLQWVPGPRVAGPQFTDFLADRVDNLDKLRGLTHL